MSLDDAAPGTRREHIQELADDTARIVAERIEDFDEDELAELRSEDGLDLGGVRAWQDDGRIVTATTLPWDGNVEVRGEHPIDLDDRPADIVDGFYEPESPHGIVAYTYQAENFTPAGLVEVLIAQGKASPAARDMHPEVVLNQIAEANGIDMEDETSFDSSDFPKIITAQQAETAGLTELVGSDGKTHVLYGEPEFDPDQYNAGANSAMAALIWTSTDDDEPVDGIDMHDDFVERVSSDFSTFLDDNPILVQRALNAGQTIERIGHDYILTRNRHGAGFWDRGLGKLGDDLTEAAQADGELDAYVGDDGFLHG